MSELTKSLRDTAPATHDEIEIARLIARRSQQKALQAVYDNEKEAKKAKEERDQATKDPEGVDIDTPRQNNSLSVGHQMEWERLNNGGYKRKSKRRKGRRKSTRRLNRKKMSCKLNKRRKSRRRKSR